MVINDALDATSKAFRSEFDPCKDENADPDISKAELKRDNA